MLTVDRLSQIIALALAALTLWALISGSQVSPADPFAIEIYALLAGIVVMVFAASFYALRLATGGSKMYWHMERRGQVVPILWMALAALAIMFALGIFLEVLGQLDFVYASNASYLLTWTLVPAAFLHFGLVAWPERTGDRPEKFKLILIIAAAICAAGLYSYWRYTTAPEKLDLLAIGPTLVRLGAVVVGATVEEIVFRVLLLTAMLSQTGSRFQAVFLSSVAFAMVHVPGQLLEPAMAADWVVLRDLANAYAPGFLIQAAMGMALGVLWLRTGSITLIATTHALLNAGHTLAVGL